MAARSALGSLLGNQGWRGTARPSTPELITATLREAIIDGLIPAGAQLRQAEVAAGFGVSVIPVREALRQLEAQGFVVLHHHRGAVVPRISLDEIAELFDIRLALETMLIRQAVPRLAAEDLARAETYLQALDDEENVVRWGHWNWLFHEALYRPANRRRTLSIVANLHHHIDRVLRLQMSLEGGKAKANREHSAILDACRARDAESAAALLDTHIRSVGAIVLRFAERSPAAGNATPGAAIPDHASMPPVTGAMTSRKPREQRTG